MIEKTRLGQMTPDEIAVWDAAVIAALPAWESYAENERTAIIRSSEKVLRRAEFAAVIADEVVEERRLRLAANMV